MLRRRAITVIWGSAALFVATVAFIAREQINYLEQATLNEAARSAEQLVAGAEVALNRSLLGVDALLGSVPVQLESSVEAGGRLNRSRAGSVLSGAVDRNRLLRGLSVVERNGQVLAASHLLASSSRLELPPALLQADATLQESSMRMSMPVREPSTAETVVWLARPITVAGRPLWAVAQVPSTLWQPVMAPSGVDHDLVVTLEREDGTLVAAAPVSVGIPGSRVAAGRLTDAMLAGKALDAADRLSGRDAVMAARPLLYAGLRVVASYHREAVLREWRGNARHIVAASLAFSLLVILAATVIHWQFNRQLRSAADAARSKAALDRALGAMDDGFLLCDSDDRIVAWNERYAAMHPWLRPVLRVGEPFSSLLEPAARNVLPGDTEGRARETWKAQRLERHRGGTLDFEQELASGEVLHIIERPTPDGGIVSVYRDVTRAERELRRAKLAAEAANDAKTRFLASMSHEIRTPLNGVLGMNSLLSSTPLSAEQQGYVRTIEASGRILLALINDILDVSRIEAGRMELEQLEFDPELAIREVMESLRPKAHQLGLELARTPHAEVLPWLRGDPNRLRQVLFNLVGNALKFTPAGRVEVDARAELTTDGQVALRLVVSDTGIGIPADVLPRLFERFAQADGSTARRYGGSGLGLSICRDIVSLMGGRIGVQSTPGQGSRFQVDLTLARAKASQRQPDPGSAGPQLQGLRILVAEDNEVNQLVVTAMLRQMGHHSHVVADGAAAVEAALTAQWDCVLMDIQMPHVDGATAARRIRAMPGPHGRVPIVALTANAMLEEQREYLAAGMNDHVSKPIDPDRLRDALRRVVVVREEAVEA